MKFQFCGNLSAAEWFLAESAILAKITSLKLRLVVGHIFRHMIDDVDNSDKVNQLLENSGFNADEIHSILASLEYIITNSVRYEVSDAVLLKELIDLGLPKENCESILKIYKENADKLKEKKVKTILKVGSLESITFSINEVVSSKKLSDKILQNNSAYVDFKLTATDKANNLKSAEIKFVSTKDKTLQFINEMKKAKEIMDSF